MEHLNVLFTFCPLNNLTILNFYEFCLTNPIQLEELDFFNFIARFIKVHINNGGGQFLKAVITQLIEKMEIFFAFDYFVYRANI